MTSQIFANIYLNEFDRFVRHHIKPLAYLRYGDDFILLLPSRIDAMQAELLATTWLSDVLKLSLHKNNTVIARASHGLQFLGHQIYPFSRASIDATMSLKLVKDINLRNVASYQAMALTRKQTKRFPWLLKDNLNL